MTALDPTTGRDGWYGVDLDGVLVEWDVKYLPDLGPPIQKGIDLVCRLLAEDKEVRIFTARVQPSPYEAAWWGEAKRLGYDTVDGWVEGQESRIQAFCHNHFGRYLPITASKDWRMILCYDDRCVQMIPNTGESLQAAYERRIRDVGKRLGEALDIFR